MNTVTTSPVLAYVHAGTSSQLTTFRDPALQPYGLREIYLPDLQPGALEDVDGLIVSDRIHPRLLRSHADAILSVPRRGGSLVVFGENAAHTWMPGVSWEPRPTNFWWWRTGEDHGMRLRAPEDPAWQFLTPSAAIWHHHGVFTPPEGAVALVAVEEGGVDVGCTTYLDRVSTPGEMLVTTLDPCFHHGAGFMKGATQMLYCAVRWLDHRTRARVSAGALVSA